MTDPIASLRVSVFRVAQAMHRGGLDHYGEIPMQLRAIGLTVDSSYGEIFAIANTQERGWNALCGLMAESMDRIGSDSRRP